MQISFFDFFFAPPGTQNMNKFARVCARIFLMTVLPPLPGDKLIPPDLLQRAPRKETSDYALASQGCGLSLSGCCRTGQ